jgi:hypothetical protein
MSHFPTCGEVGGEAAGWGAGTPQTAEAEEEEVKN